MEAEAAEADDVSEEQTEVSVHQYCNLTIDGDHVHLVFEHLPSHHLQNHTSPAVLASHTVAFHRSRATVVVSRQGQCQGHLGLPPYHMPAFSFCLLRAPDRIEQAAV